MRAALFRDSLPDHGMTSEGGGATDAIPVLVVEDDVTMVQALDCYFANRGIKIIAVDTVAAAKRCVASRLAWTLVISDFHLPDGTGWELYTWIGEQRGVSAPFLLISGAAVAAAYADKVEFLAKPFSVQQLDQRVNAVLKAFRTSATPASKGV